MAGFFIALLSMLFLSVNLSAIADDSLCLDCHGDRDLKNFRDGKRISLYVDNFSFGTSAHGEVGCVGCHTDLEGIEEEHPPELQPVNCGTCHEDIEDVYQRSLHAKAIRAGVTDSANCTDCHGNHYVLPKENPCSLVYPMNIEKTCDQCHADVASVQEHRGIPGRVFPGLIYKESVHGRAVEAGIEGAATCIDCHSNHNLKSMPMETKKKLVKTSEILILDSLT